MTKKIHCNKKRFGLSILFFLMTLLYSNQIIAQFTFEEGDGFVEGNSYRLLADDVNVRTQPNTKGEKIAKLAITTEVTLLTKESQTLTINGLVLPWCKIAYNENGVAKEGYVWLGFLAYVYAESGKDVFLVGPGKATKGEYSWTYSMQVRHARNQKEISRMDMEHSASYIPESVEAFGSKGLDNAKNVLKISCPYESWASEYFLILNEDKLYYVGSLGFSWDSPAFQQEAYIFPEDEGGKPNRVIWTHKSGEEDVNGDGEDSYVEEKRAEYLWSGEMLIDMNKK